MSVLYARLKDKNNIKFLYRTMADTGMTMRELSECVLQFCRESKEFHVKPKVDTIGRKLAARKRRVEKYRKLARA